MDKKIKYNNPEEKIEKSKVEEPVAEYHSMIRSDATISDKELALNCMTLEESKRRMLERIYIDYHK